MTPTGTIRRKPASAGWPALGTSAVVQVVDPEALDRTREIVSRELAAIDLACSRFRPDSELEHVNAGAPQPVRVGALLLEAVEVALHAYDASDGDVDPALGEALLLAGYDRDYDLLDRSPTAEPTAIQLKARRVAGRQTIAIDRTRSTVRVGRGVRLDLGATAKALASDRAAKVAFEATGSGTLVNLGGDIAVAGDAPEGGWAVFVTDDHRNSLDAPGQLVTILSGGLATSSVTTRRWQHRGHANHHIIDPRSGAPAQSCWRTVSVAAANCVDANVAATASLVRGESALGWLEAAQLPARLVAHDGEVSTVGDWPEEGTP